jgi:hypothetical protein
MTLLERASAANVCVLRNPIDQTLCGVAGGAQLKRNCLNMANLVIPLAPRPAAVRAAALVAQQEITADRTKDYS